MYALAVEEVASSFTSTINILFLNDVAIGHPEESVCEDLRRIIPMLTDIGFKVNPSV